jgi:hypothetical protein
MAVDDKMVERLASEYVGAQYVKEARVRTAGEIRHVKDNGPVKRQNVKTHNYRPKDLKKLTRVLWHLSVALGHLGSGVTQFTKMKSIHISPDGRLGGRGYDKAVADIRKELYGAVEAVSAIQDTLYDEISAPHWKPVVKELPKKEREEVEEVIEEVEEIRDDPEAYGDEAYEEEVEEALSDEKEEKDDSDFDLPSVLPGDE